MRGIGVGLQQCLITNSTNEELCPLNAPADAYATSAKTVTNGETTPSNASNNYTSSVTQPKGIVMSTEDQVRQRLQEILSKAGVDESRVALEVLYWLPSEFIEAYIELFQQALSLGNESHTPGGQEGKAKVSSQRRGKKGSMQARGGGKKYYKGEWIVKNDEALEIKRRVDRRLGRLIGKVRGDYQAEKAQREKVKKLPSVHEGRPAGVGVDEADKKIREVARERGLTVPEYKVVREPQGSTPGQIEWRDKVGELVEKQMGRAIQKVCRDCGKINKRQSSTCRYCND